MDEVGEGNAMCAVAVAAVAAVAAGLDELICPKDTHCGEWMTSRSSALGPRPPAPARWNGNSRPVKRGPSVNGAGRCCCSCSCCFCYCCCCRCCGGCWCCCCCACKPITVTRSSQVGRSWAPAFHPRSVEKNKNPESKSLPVLSCAAFSHRPVFHRLLNCHSEKKRFECASLGPIRLHQLLAWYRPLFQRFLKRPETDSIVSSCIFI